MELIIGSHVSFTKEKQLLGCVLDTIAYGANTFMFYTGAPQNTNRIDINNNLTKEAIELMKKNSIDINNVVVHAPYIINLANDDSDKYNFSISFLKQEIKRCEQLGITKLVLHPGSHVGLGIERGLNNIIYALNKCLENDTNVIILLETMSGKGSELGSNFEQIKSIINGITHKKNIGVCLDTCHINDYGYDVSDFDKVLDDFDNIIGLNKLMCLHINDSLNNIGEKKDRHANIGYGKIGFDNLIKIIYNNRLSRVPKILETPYVSENNNEKEKIYPPYKQEIVMIKNKKFNVNLLDDIRKYYIKESKA